MNGFMFALVAVTALVGCCCAVVYLIRRHQPPGLAAWIAYPASIGNQVLIRYSEWLGRGSSRMHDHAQANVDKALHGTDHRLGSGIMHVGLAAAWLTVTTLLITRNASIVLGGYREAVAAGAVGVRPAAGLIALAEVIAPVLLTAMTGIIVFEVFGWTKHLPFLHREARSQRIGLIGASLAILAVSMTMQFSVAREDMANAYNDAVATIEARRSASIVPLPISPTAAEVGAFNRSTEEFNALVAAPLLSRHAATIGPTGWRTLLPIGAALVDFVFAFALIPAAVLAWVLLVKIIRAGVELARSAATGLAFVVRVSAGALLAMFGLPAPVDTAPAPPAPVSPHATAPPSGPATLAGPAAPRTSASDPLSTVGPPDPAPPAAPAPPWSPIRANPIAPASTASRGHTSVDRWNPFTGPIAPPHDLSTPT